MKLNTLLSAMALGFASVAAAPLHAATITNSDGTFGFTGFDWDSNGTAFTTGFAPVATDTFTLEYFGWATSVKNGAINLALAGLDNNANGVAAPGFPFPGVTPYEYTVYAVLNEKVDSCVGTTCTFSVLSGDYYIYYDTAADANALSGSLGTGFRNGDLLIQGTFDAQPGGSFTVSGPGGQGITTLQGLVSTTNLTYINPALTNTVVGTTLQLGNATTNNWVSPGGFDGVAFGGPGSGTIVFQADANQSFSTEVPEPASLALVAAALLAGGLATRRRKV